MGSAIAEVLPTAFALALINPIPIMAIIVMLSAPKAGASALAFAVGWIAGLTASLALLLLVISSGAVVGDAREPSPLSSMIRLLLGVTLLALALRKWQGRPGPGEEQALPSWMATLDRANPAATLGLGAVLSGVNPKNLAFNIATAVAIAQAELTTAATLLPFAIYVLLGSVGVLVPLVWYAVARDSAMKTLTGWRSWLTANYSTMMSVVFVLFGVKLFSQGLGGLIG